MDNFIGKTIERYEIIEKIGEGGMAVVYKARDTRLNCFVALKLIQMERLTREMADSSIKRFEREAKAVALLTHPNIVKVSDYGEYEGIPFLVMEYIPGGTLKSRMGKQIPYDEAARLLLPIARALQYAHSHHIIHRDIKPSNILLTETNEPKLIDFGIAKILDLQEGHTLTATGVGLGTPEYMAPEQWLGKISPAVDVYSLGAILYELITGTKPFTADNSAEVMLKTINEPLPRLTCYVPNLPEQAEYCSFKALANSVEKRFRSMNEMVQMLEQMASEDFSSAPKTRKKIDLQKEFMTIEKKKQNVDSIPRGKKPSVGVWIVLGLLIVSIVGAFFILPKTGLVNRLFQQNGITDASSSTASTPDLSQTATSSVPTETPTLSPTSTIANPNASVSEIPRNGKGAITQIKYSPDGSKIGVATTIGIYVYSAETFTQLFFIETGTTTTHIAFSPDGQTLAANSTDNLIWLWNANDGQLIQTLTGHLNQVNSVAFSGDGKYLASASYDGTKIWQMPEGTLINTLDTFDQSVDVMNVALSQDGQLVACLTSSGRTWIRNTSNGALLYAFGEGNGSFVGYASEMAFSPDGKLFYGGGRAWRLSNGYEQTSAGYGDTQSFDLKTKASILMYGGINISTLEDDILITSISAKGSSVTHLALSANGDSIAASYSDGTLYFWTINSNSAKVEKSEDNFIQTDVIDIAFSEDGKKLASIGNKNVNLWQISDGKLLNTNIIKLDNSSNYLLDENNPLDIHLSPNALYYAYIEGENKIIVRKTIDNSLFQSYEGDRIYISSILFSNDSKSIIFDPRYWSSDGSNIWDMKKNEITTVLNSHDNIMIFPTSDGDKLISGYKNGIRLWQLPAGTLLYSTDTGGVYPDAVTPDGETMAIGTYDGTVELRRVSDGIAFKTIDCYTDQVTSVAFSSDGSLMAAGTNDGTVEVFQLTDDALIQTFQGQTGMITKVLFSPNNKLIASSSSDGSIRFWNIEE